MINDKYLDECKVLRDEIVKKYPRLFKSRWGHPTVMKGWLLLIDKCCETIQSYVDKNNLPQPEFTTIKEKFGSLRLSLDNSDTFIDDIIFEYQRLSYYICEYCGSTENVGRTEQGWIFTICDKCFFKDEHFSKFIWKQNKKQYKDFISELKNTKDK